jgi:hypothetical protein
METGELLTRWTVRVAAGLYVLALALRLSARDRPWLVCARLFWTVGCFAFLLHVVCAFQFYHHWSHSVAYETTANQTADVVGLHWGGGLYANYAFALVWLVDVAWWWRGLERYEARPRYVEWTIQGFLGFMMFNATIVFGRAVARWLGLAGCLFLALMILARARRRSISSSKSGSG